MRLAIFLIMYTVWSVQWLSCPYLVLLHLNLSSKLNAGNMAEAVELHYSSRAIQVISWVGPDMSHRLLSAARQNLNGIAGNFATRLRYVSARLLEQEVDAFSPNAQSLALETLRDLVTIFHVRSVNCPLGAA